MTIDKELQEAVELMKKGDSQGFAAFYEHTHDYVYKRAKFIMQNEDDALDLTQETYIQAYKGVSGLEKVENIYAWLGSIAYRQGMRIFRDRKELLVEEEGEFVFDDMVSEDKDYSPDQSAEAQATVDIVMGFIDELPELQRAAIIAFYYDNKKIDEIAEEAGCSANTIKSRLNYAKKFLRDKVEAHEKSCGYKLHSVTPFIIISALGGILGGNGYTISAKASELVLAGVSGNTGVVMSASGVTTTVAGSGVVAVGSSSAAVSGAAAVATKVGLGLGAKIAIGVATLALAGGVAVGGMALLSSDDERETQIVGDSEVGLSGENGDQIADNEQGNMEDNTDKSLYPSVWEQTFERHIQSGTNHIFLTDDEYGYLLSEKTLIYVVDKQGEYEVLANKDDAGQKVYKSITQYSLLGFVAKLTKEDGTFELLESDGSIFGAGKGYVQVGMIMVNGEQSILAKKMVGDVASFDIYNADREPIIEDFTDLSALISYNVIGSYTYISGNKADETKAILVYDTAGKCVDTIEGTSTYNKLFGDTYVWDGTTLWDENHNAVAVPIPTNLTEIGQVSFWDIYAKNEEITTVHAAVTTAEGEVEYFVYGFDSQLNIRNDVDDPTYIVWVDNGEVLVMRDGNDGDRFVALASDEEPLFWIYDWATPMEQIYETYVDPYSINAYMYDDGVMLVEITVFYNSEKDGDVFATNAFFLYEEDGYAIDKAVNLGQCDYLSHIDDIWYDTTTGFLLQDGQVSYHQWMFKAGDGVYYYEIEITDDGTVYNIYTAYGDKVCTVDGRVKAVVNKNVCVVTTSDLKYKLMKSE